MNSKHRKPIDPLKSAHVKSGDEVVVISGSHRGQRGKVVKVLLKRHRVVVEGVHIVKKATRKSPANPEGGILEREGAIHISNVVPAARFDASKRRSKAA